MTKQYNISNFVIYNFLAIEFVFIKNTLIPHLT